MSGQQYWEVEDDHQNNIQRHDSSGEFRYSSSECSSYSYTSPNSINGTTYGAQSPTELFAITHHLQCPKSIIESMKRATPYSPHQKKERIERYRSKRNLRNFNKKIKYECRKTLADSRPRVRGRFARNDEIDKSAAPQTQSWDHQYIEEHLDINDDYNWIAILEALSTNFMS